jgi:ribonuclease HI
MALFDEKGAEIWQGGAPIRADGNNYVAEVAAAALVLDAAPSSIPLHLYMDSTSAMAAIQKGTISERRNIRTPARNWVNLAKTAIKRRTAALEVTCSFSSRDRNF